MPKGVTVYIQKYFGDTYSGGKLEITAKVCFGSFGRDTDNVLHVFPEKHIEVIIRINSGRRSQLSSVKYVTLQIRERKK